MRKQLQSLILISHFLVSLVGRIENVEKYKRFKFSSTCKHPSFIIQPNLKFPHNYPMKNFHKPPIFLAQFFIILFFHLNKWTITKQKEKKSYRTLGLILVVMYWVIKNGLGFGGYCIGCKFTLFSLTKIFYHLTMKNN